MNLLEVDDGRPAVPSARPPGRRTRGRVRVGASRARAESFGGRSRSLQLEFCASGCAEGMGLGPRPLWNEHLKCGGDIAAGVRRPGRPGRPWCRAGWWTQLRLKLRQRWLPGAKRFGCGTDAIPSLARVALTRLTLRGPTPGLFARASSALSPSPARYLRLRTRSMIVVLGRRFSVPFLTKRPLMASRTRLPGPAPRVFCFLAMTLSYPTRGSATRVVLADHPPKVSFTTQLTRGYRAPSGNRYGPAPSVRWTCPRKRASSGTPAPELCRNSSG